MRGWIKTTKEDFAEWLKAIEKTVKDEGIGSIGSICGACKQKMIVEKIEVGCVLRNYRVRCDCGNSLFSYKMKLNPKPTIDGKEVK